MLHYHYSLTQLLLATCASAAYVQWQHCDGYVSDAARFVPETWSASLAHVNSTHERLSVRGRKTANALNG
ncbi:hypothetical protein GGR53DRAFT_413781 [Hypoxylon sp. FL1150]|nr:hypothetical protein GGR53DRAFT_413781 [Hypoxylon sp. FL1150]